MNSHQSFYSLLRKLWPHISARRRFQLFALMGLMFLGALAEVISLGLMLPFLGVITAPDSVYANPLVQPLIEALDLTTSLQLILPLTIIFCFAALLSGSVRLTLLWTQTHLGNAIGNDLGSEAFRRTLYQPYSVHCSKNSSEVIAILITKINTVINSVVIPALSLITSSFIVMMIIAFMLYIDPELTLISFTSFGVIYIVIAYITRKRLTINGLKIAEGQNKVTKVVQEGLGGIKEVLINGLQEMYYTQYSKSDRQLRRALANINITGASPRPIVESFGLVFIAILAYILSNRPEGITAAIPLLGALALSAQRLLPLIQQGYSSWASMIGGKSSLNDVLSLLNQTLPYHSSVRLVTPMPFKDKIVIENISFRYSADNPWILENVSISIPKGARVGFIGSTGSGKSTLLDIVMGLLNPATGEIGVDGIKLNPGNQTAWQAHIAHVPQTIFLIDSSIAENIALGIEPEHINIDKVQEVARKAQIADAIESWQKGYNTLVGERGIRLSGGQRQRIGIARALYKNADVIVFDEATSALDNETEQAVIESIKHLDKELTILIVAHRITTLRNCDFIVELKDGILHKVASYNELIKNLQ
nr:ATP-binding cassette domain-containing protein [Cytophagales bacterium]